MSFLDDYVDYANGICYAPEIYPQMMARSLVGMACRNHVYFQLGDTRIFLNFWMILIGLSSSYHKSTSIKNGLAIMDRVDENHRFADQWSPEALIPFLATRPSCTFFVDEFEAFMEIMKKDYMGGGSGFLRTLYDVPAIWTKKLSKETFTIRFPTMTIQAAATVSDFVENVSEKHIRNGFIARYLTVFARDRHRDANRLPPPVDELKKNMIVQKLHDISDFVGVNYLPEVMECKPPMVFTLNDELMKSYILWQNKIDEEMVGNIAIMPALSRLTIYLLKLCVVESVSDFSAEITMKHFNRAMGLVETLHDSIVDLYKNEFTHSDFSKDVKRVLDAIRSEPNGISLSGFKDKGIRIPKNSRNDILSQLEENGEIEIKSMRLPGADKHTTFYVYKENRI